MKRADFTAAFDLVYTRKKAVLFILSSFYAVGVLWHAIPFTFPIMLLLTPYVLLIFGLFIFFSALPEGGKPFLLWAAATFVVTFAAEAVGVATGEVFGQYLYGDVLGIKLFGVPLLIGFNWTVVVLGIASFFSTVVHGHTRMHPVRRRQDDGTDSVRSKHGSGPIAAGHTVLDRPDDGTKPNTYGRHGTESTGLSRLRRSIAVILLTAGCGVLFDFFMEPVAISLGYWHWREGIVSMRNYLAWFVIGVAAASGYELSGIRITTIYPRVYVLIQALFFIALRFVVA